MGLRALFSCRCIKTATSCFSPASVSRMYVRDGLRRSRTVRFTKAS